MSSLIPAELQEAIASAPSISALKAALIRWLPKLGFRWFAYAELSAPALDPRFITQIMNNYPGLWTRTYAALGMFSRDPVHRIALQKSVPFSWRDQWFGPFMKLARNNGIHDGVSVGMHGQDGSFAILSLVPEGSAARRRYVGEQSTGFVAVLGALIHKRSRELAAGETLL